METLEAKSVVMNSKNKNNNKKKENTLLIPLNTKEKKLIHNVSTKYNLHNNYSSSVDNRKNSFSYRKNMFPSSLLNLHQQNENLDKNEKEKENFKKSIYKILVAVRCRPLTEREKEISTKETIQIIDNKVIKLKDPNGFLNPNNKRGKEQILEFDYAFNNNDSQEIIFNCTTQPLIEGIINGFNATVFAYGATGAGKTYTMLGDDENPGIMSLTFGELFKKIKNLPDREYVIKLCYLEIYNENIKDLLINNSPNLELREDPNKGLIINGITEIITNSGEHILSILKKGNKNRTTEATNINQTSSRSHAILQIIVSYKEKDKNINNNNKIKYGKLSLIDLAGSERASATKNRGMRLIEGANINKSLLALGNCINALCESNLKGTKPHIPYRDSKLTRLLKDSLGGNSRTVMIANVSPFIYSFDDTYNTLNYADRAKHIKTRVKTNIVNNKNANVNNYLDVIKHLQNKVILLQNQLNTDNNSNKNDKNYINNDDLFIKEKEKKKEDKNEIYNFLDKKNGRSKSLEKNNKRNSKKENEVNNKNNYINKIIDKKNIGDIIEQNEKKINRIIEEYVQLTKAEVQIKQKVMGIKYDIFNLNNKILNNESFFPISLSSSFSQRGKSEKTKLRSLKRILDKNISLLNDISQKNENILKKYTENNIEESSIEMTDIQKNYISLISKNSVILKENIEIKYDYAILKSDLEKKDNYIKELLKQIDLRDNIIKNKLIKTKNIEEEKEMNKEIKNLMSPRQKLEYLTLNQLEYKYSLLDMKNPYNLTLNKNSSFCSTHNYSSRYHKNKYSFRPRNSSFIEKRENISKQKFDFDDLNLETDNNYIYNESDNYNNTNLNNSGLNLGLNINYIYSNRDKNLNKNKSQENNLILKISNKKNNLEKNNKNKLNIGPMSLKNLDENNTDLKNKEGMFNFNHNFINSSDEENEYDINKEENGDSIDKDIDNENDITFQSMLNDIEIMNYDIKSKLNIIENNSNIKNSENNNNTNNIIKIKQCKKKNKTSKKKNNNNNIKNLNNKKNNKIKNNIKNKINNLKSLDNKNYTIENDPKNNLITKNTNKKDKDINLNSNNQIYVNRLFNNKKNINNNIPKKNSFAPLTYEVNNKTTSLKKVNTNYQKDLISSSTPNLNNNLNNAKNKKNRNSSMANRNLNIKDKNYITNIMKQNYKTNTNTNENLQNRNLNKSVIIPQDKKITLDLLMDEAKKRYNKNKLKNNNNILINENDNDNEIDSNKNKNKLQQFYAEHLNKNNIINKRNINILNNEFDNNYNFKNNNDNFEFYKSYEYPEKNINVINNKKNFNFKIDSKENTKNYDKFNVKQLTKNDIRKKVDKK